LRPKEPSGIRQKEVALGFAQFGHGSNKLTVLFNDPADVE
jgi:hypothetical protein